MMVADQLVWLPTASGAKLWVAGVLDRFSGLRQPWSPIPATVTRLTGIDDAMVAGHEIGCDAVAAFLRGVDLVVAHNARFDRPFVEARWPVFSRLSWACYCTASNPGGLPR